MKRILLLLITVISTFQAYSQGKAVYISTNYKQECWWNETEQKYDNCTGSEESSLFKLNSEGTMFHHTTEKLSSDYYVSKHEHDTINDVYTYDVKSDVGNSYYFVIDLKNNQFRIVGTTKGDNSQTYMNVYTIKKSWTEE